MNPAPSVTRHLDPVCVPDAAGHSGRIDWEDPRPVQPDVDTGVYLSRPACELVECPEAPSE